MRRAHASKNSSAICRTFHDFHRVEVQLWSLSLFGSLILLSSSIFAEFLLGWRSTPWDEPNGQVLAHRQVSAGAATGLGARSGPATGRSGFAGRPVGERDGDGRAGVSLPLSPSRGRRPAPSPTPRSTMRCGSTRARSAGTTDNPPRGQVAGGFR